MQKKTSRALLDSSQIGEEVAYRKVFSLCYVVCCFVCFLSSSGNVACAAGKRNMCLLDAFGWR